MTGGKALPPHRTAALRDILDPRTGEVLDQVRAVPLSRVQGVTGGKALPPHRTAALRDILDPRTGEVLDQVRAVPLSRVQGVTGDQQGSVSLLTSDCECPGDC